MAKKIGQGDLDAGLTENSYTQAIEPENSTFNEVRKEEDFS